jgi:hypothetical protein
MSLLEFSQIIPILERVELLSTLMLTGLIWTIQVVHYPLLARIGPENFQDYERAHCQRITWIVAPLMFLELSSNLAIAYASSWSPQVCGRLGLVFIVWFSTALIQVPLHSKLNGGYDIQAIQALVRTNWIRTAAWSLRAILLIGGY